MSHDTGHDHHREDHSVNIKVAVFFIVVLVVITLIGIIG
jgi:hypothetical protein